MESTQNNNPVPAGHDTKFVATNPHPKKWDRKHVDNDPCEHHHSHYKNNHYSLAYHPPDEKISSIFLSSVARNATGDAENNRHNQSGSAT